MYHEQPILSDALLYLSAIAKRPIKCLVNGRMTAFRHSFPIETILTETILQTVI